MNYDLRHNIYALLAAAYSDLTPERALTEMGLANKKYTPRKSGPRKYFLSDKDYEEIIRLKREGLMWKEIGEKYNIPERIMAQLVRKYMGAEWKNRGW